MFGEVVGRVGRREGSKVVAEHKSLLLAAEHPDNAMEGLKYTCSGYSIRNTIPYHKCCLRLWSMPGAVEHSAQVAVEMVAVVLVLAASIQFA